MSAGGDESVGGQRILVTGAAGFIGARTCRMLLEQGHAVVGVDNLNDYYDVRLKDHRLDLLLGGDGTRMGADPRSSFFERESNWKHEEFTFLYLDIEDGCAVARLFERWRFDAVINLAARAGVRYSVEHPEVYASTNVSGAVNLLQAMARHGTRKYVLASSSSLYAGAAAPFKETADVTRPLSPYAASKLGAEAMASAFHNMHGIDVSVLRYFTVFGPAGRPDMSPLRFIKWIDEGTPIELFGDGTQARDFTFVDDIAAGTILALKPVGYEVINLGGGRQPMTINAMIRVIEARLRKTALVEHQEFHSGDMHSTQADVGKAARLLGWASQVDAVDGFGRTVDWYSANRDWLRKIVI